MSLGEYDCHLADSIAAEFDWAEMTDPAGGSSRPSLMEWRTGPARSVMEKPRRRGKRFLERREG